MVDGIQGRVGALAREATLAAMKAQASAAEGVRALARETAAEAASVSTGPSSSTGAEASGAPNFADALKNGIAEINAEVQRAEALPADLVQGQIGDLSEVAGRLKTAELTFRFSMEIRNKLIDAYREVMRMQV